MPNPHFDVQIVTRGQGQSVVAAAAYRSGEALYDEKTGKTFDYTRKEDIKYVEIATPDDAPAWANDRSALWNHVEASEKRKDARLARSIIAGLPRELDQEQNLALIRDFVQENLVSKGMIADFALHEADAGDGQKNPHVHILITLRPLEADGFGKKNREWDHKNTLLNWRNSWEAHTNKHLELAGRVERVSLKSYKAQGINKHPQVHLGEDAGNLEKRGIETSKGDHNRKMRHENALIEILAPAYSTELEAEAGSINEGLESRDSQTEKGQMQGASAFLTADPTARLEAMTMELKDDLDEYADQKSENGSQRSEQGANGKEGVLGAFRKPDQDSEDLAVASLEASKALHETAVREYLEAPQHQTFKGQITERLTLAEYGRLTSERLKALSQKAVQQFRNLIQETGRIKQKERSDELER